jgi:pyruvate dehydrogenase (quinone)
VIPDEMFFHPAPAKARAASIRRATSTTVPSEADLQAALDVLNESGSVTILAGAGCAGAHSELMAVAERLQAPIVHTFRGKEVIEYDNPYDVGMTGLLGFPSGYRAMEHCDTLLMLGTDFPYETFYPESARVVQVDIRGQNIGRRVAVDVGLVGGVKETIAALLPRLAGDRDSGHLDRMTHHYRRTRKQFTALTEAKNDRGPLHPQTITAAIDRIASDDAVFIPDVGTPVMWAARYLTMNGRRRLIGSFSHGSMANALPHAIGVQSTEPNRQVVTLSGDGGISMLLGELLTLRQLRLPVKVVVFNNGALAFVDLEMKAVGVVNWGTDLDNPSFAEVARAIGLFGVRVEHPSELDDALRDAFSHDGPALIEVMTLRHELVIPPGVTFEQAKGFTLWATRSILGGAGGDVIEVAKSNLRQVETEFV